MISSRGGVRTCTRTECSQRAVATLSYNYGAQKAHLAPLASHQEPHTYDLCLQHSQSLTVPKGWKVEIETISMEPEPSNEDLQAIADAVRSAGAHQVESEEDLTHQKSDLGRRGHLRAL
ncbi:MAG: DUF3499 domain-containing protein [Actinobacteria bacterium]|jgi:hypothetical protein|nr:DUF3499 domain-containing protein [Actinomycetota bacterium]MDA2984271.1 DUF3499 domain-containing protein [Actinomycetota bacterium]